MTIKPKIALLALTALVAATTAGAAHAQSPVAPAADSSASWGTPGHSMMMGPGMMDRSELDRVCRPGAAGFAEWRIDLLDELLKPTDAQKLKFDEFKTASSNAGETMRSACPGEIPTSMIGHMQAMEKLTDAKSHAIKAILPALEAFYATLSPDQKAALNSREGRSRFWRWRDPV